MGKFTDAIRLPSAKFPTVGTAVSGFVVEVSESDVPQFDDKGRISGVRVDEAGEVLRQIDVVLATETGRVVLHTGGSIYYAIGRALAEIDAEDLLVGDALTVTYTGDGEPTAKGRTAPKQYEAVIGAVLEDKSAAKAAKVGA